MVALLLSMRLFITNIGGKLIRNFQLRITMKKITQIERTQLFQQLREKGTKLKALKEQKKNNTDEAKKLWQEYKAIAELLEWKIT